MQLVPDEAAQVVVHHDPLVVPAHLLLRPVEQLVLGDALARQPLKHRVVELQERAVQLADHGVLVVAGVTDQRPPLTVARQVHLAGVAAVQ